MLNFLTINNENIKTVLNQSYLFGCLDDNFTDDDLLPFDSITLLSFLERVSKEFGIHINPEKIHYSEFQTINTICEYLKRNYSEAHS